MTAFVYFLRVGDDGPVKIGIASDVSTRIANLQVGSAWPLNLLGTFEGTTFHEMWLHRKFAEHRMLGEWFRPAPEIFAIIAAIQNPDFDWGDRPEAAKLGSSASEFLRSIEDFIVRAGMSATAFGIAAVGDPRFVGDIRRGRAPGLAIVDRVREYMNTFTIPHPAETTAATERNQPRAPVAAVTISEPARALPPTHSSLASILAEASHGASALSSVLPSAGDRQAVAAIGPALVATADPFSALAMRRKQSAFRVAAASAIAEQQPSISKSGV